MKKSPSLAQEIPNTATLTERTAHTGPHCTGHPTHLPSRFPGNQATWSKTAQNLIKLTLNCILYLYSLLTSRNSHHLPAYSDLFYQPIFPSSSSKKTPWRPSVDAWKTPKLLGLHGPRLCCLHIYIILFLSYPVLLFEYQIHSTFPFKFLTTFSTLLNDKQTLKRPVVPNLLKHRLWGGSSPQSC